jgi:thiol-disulfide isomerase/thioredoxin
MKMILPLLFLCLLLSGVGMAQSSNLKQINIGDNVPDIQINNLRNYKTSSVKISDFEGKLLIIDFWATWCSPCVAMLPTTDSLQRVFKDKVQFLAVTDQSKQVVDGFLDHINHVKKIDVAVVSDDRELARLFRHTYIPHFVWIDKVGTVFAITDEAQVTAKNIRAVIEGRLRSLPTKTDSINTSFDIKKDQLFNSGINKGISEDSLFTQSTFSGYKSGYINELRQDSGRIVVTNASIEALYAVAAGKFMMQYIFPSRFIADVRDTLLSDIIRGYCPGYGYTEARPEIIAWQKKHSFCYELTIPKSMRGVKNSELMLEDLNRYFGAVYHVKGGLENRMVKCLVLKKSGDSEKFRYITGDKKMVVDDYSIQIHGHHIQTFVNLLGKQYQLAYPILDETNYPDLITIDLNCKLSDLTTLNTELKKYGLTLNVEDRVTSMVVVRDVTPDISQKTK